MPKTEYFSSPLLAARNDLGPRPLDFGVELVSRAGIVDDDMGELAFVRHRHLCREQSPRPFVRHPSSNGPLELQFGITPDDGEQIVGPPPSGLDEERRFHNRHRARSEGGEPPFDTVANEGMDRSFEPRPRPRVG